MPMYEIDIGPKSLRETLCGAQTAIANADVYDINHRERDMEKLSRLIAECDRMRPLGPDGTHGDRHTDRCGCEGTEGLYAPDGTPIPAQPKYQLQFDTTPVGRQNGKTTGLLDAVEQYAQELRDRHVPSVGADEKDRLLHKLSQGMGVPPEILTGKRETMSEEQLELHTPNSGKPVDDCAKDYHSTFNAAGVAFPAMMSYWHEDGCIITYCLLCGLDVVDAFRRPSVTVSGHTWQVEPRREVIEDASHMAALPFMTVLVGKDDWVWQKMDVIPGEPDVWRSTSGTPLRADQIITRYSPLRVLHRPEGGDDK